VNLLSEGEVVLPSNSRLQTAVLHPLQYFEGITPVANGTSHVFADAQTELVHLPMKISESWTAASKPFLSQPKRG